MKIETGKIYLNRTYHYLCPVLKTYGELFSAKANSITKLAFGIFDNNLEGTPYQDQKNIFILINTAVNPSHTLKVLEWFRYQDYYVLDYVVGETSRMLVIQYPEKLSHAYSCFLESKYSHMYTKEELAMFFKKEGTHFAYGVLTRNKVAMQRHIEEVKSIYDVTITYREIVNEGYQLDFPWKKEEEIFNFKLS